MKNTCRAGLSKVVWVLTVGLLAVANCRADCFEDAGAKYEIAPVLLRAIAKTESDFNPYAISPINSNGTRDYGMMQVNSVWLPTLRRFGITKLDLLNGCQSIHVGAWILAQCIQTYGDTWAAVGCYNVGYGDSIKKRAKKVKYVAAVRTNLKRITNGELVAETK